MTDHTQQTLDDGMPTPEFIDSTEAELFAHAVLGEQAVDFLNSDLGRLLRGRAEQRKQDAKDAVIGINPMTPWGRRKIRKLQFEAAVADQFLQFIAQTVNDGRQAEQQLRQYRDQA